MTRAKRTITYPLPIRNLPETAPFTALRAEARRRQCVGDAARGLGLGLILGVICWAGLWFGIHALVNWVMGV